MNVTAQKFHSLYAPVCKSLAWRNHRTTLPQSRIRSTAPSGREPGNIPHNANHPPADEISSGRVIFGLVWGYFFHSTGCLRNRGVGGRFSSPLRNSEWLTAPIHRGTLPQSASLTAPSGREPGTVARACTIQPGTCETVGVRAIFIAPTKLRMFYISPFNVLCALFEGGYGFCMVKIWMGFWAVIRW